MSEYSREPLYFVKMPKGFFDQHWVKILEGMKDGDRCLLFYLKLMCESIGHGGYLRYSEEKPYDGAMIAAVTGVSPKFAEKALETLKMLGLAEITETGTILLPKVGEMVIKTTRGADTKADKRRTKGGQKEEKNSPDIRYKNLDIRDLDNRIQEGHQEEAEMAVSDEEARKAIESICGKGER